MGHRRKSRQGGLSFITLIIVIAFLAGLGLLAAQAFPTFLEYQAALKAANRAAAGSTVPEVRQLFDKTADVDNIRSISGKDLTVTKEGDKVVVSFAYDKEIHIWGPAYLLLKYVGRSK